MDLSKHLLSKKRILLGQRLRTLRRESGLTREEITKKYNFSARSIRTWEVGERDIKAIILIEYLKVFELNGIKVSLDALFDFEEELVTVAKKTIVIK